MGTVDLRDADASCGAKAWRLGMMLRAGLPVPPGVVVVPSGSAPSVAPPVGNAAALLEGPVAVRSSATVEDGDAASFAGQLESVLGVAGRQAVEEAVERCATSGRSARAGAYAERVGVPVPQHVPVVVQRLVEADTSGVLFTRDPRTGTDVVVIEAAWGLGPSVVDGSVVPDLVTVTEDGSVSTRPGDKPTRVDRVPGGTRTTVVAAPDLARPCLTDEQARELAALGRAVQALLGVPVDVEWAIEGARTWLLQARPVTGRPPSPAARSGATRPLALLTGTAAGPGRASGPVRVVHDVDGFRTVRHGDVLVCRTTDPAWTPLFGIVSAVVTESGGILSHAAIVAREVGIPAVVGAAGATVLLHDGTPVTVDGSDGTVAPTSDEPEEDQR